MANPNPIPGWKPGKSGNPSGRPKGTGHWQKPAERIQKWLNEKSVSQLAAIVSDQAQFQKLSLLDATCLTTIAAGLNQRDPHSLLNRKEVFDRGFGQSNQKLAVEHSGSIAADAGELSITLNFIGQLVRAPAKDASSESVQERSILSDTVCLEPPGHGEKMANGPVPGSPEQT